MTNRAELMTYMPGAASSHDKLATTEGRGGNGTVAATAASASVTALVAATSSTQADGTVVLKNAAFSSAGVGATATPGSTLKSAAVEARRLGSGVFWIVVLATSLAIAGLF